MKSFKQLLSLALLGLCRGDVVDSEQPATEVEASDAQRPNIIFIMMDDLGNAGLGMFGAQWDTPNIDHFRENSIYLDHHYIGFVCSASRTQFLTGRYAWNLGYGALNVFTDGKPGGIPLGTPILSEYLKQYGGYSNYAIGKWQLGQSFDEQTPNYRGFDYFWGFYGGMLDYYEKTAPVWASGSAPEGSSYPDYIANDDNWYLDFWENGEPTYEGQGKMSTEQYFDKMVEVIDNHLNTKGRDEPFFIYNAIQVAHWPFPTQTTGGYNDDDKIYQQKCFNEFETDNDVCVVTINFDEIFGKFMNYLNSDDMKDVFDNTLIVFTADNGGDLSYSCNYPLRGGKNTYFEGNQRVSAFVGGGIIPDSRRGIKLSGLISNVDWVPTLLSFAGVVPHSYTQMSVSGMNDNEDVPLVLDGYNFYEYLVTEDVEPVRDHIMFILAPKLDDHNQFAKDYHALSKDVGSLSIDDFSLEEIALLFFDDDGVLWKYIDAAVSKNELGDVHTNSRWCDLVGPGETAGMSDSITSLNDVDGLGSPRYHLADSVSDVFDFSSDDTGKALFDVTHDGREVLNYLRDDLTIDLSDSEWTALESIIVEKIGQYFDKDLVGDRSDYVFGSFDCFYDNLMQLAWPGYFNDVFAPFLTRDSFTEYLSTDCGFQEYDTMYKLHSQQFSFVDLNEDETSSETSETSLDKLISDESSLWLKRNSRRFTPAEEEFDLDNLESVVKTSVEESVKDVKIVKSVRKNGESVSTLFAPNAQLIVLFALAAIAISVVGLVCLCQGGVGLHKDSKNVETSFVKKVSKVWSGANYGSV